MRLLRLPRKIFHQAEQLLIPPDLLADETVARVVRPLFFLAMLGFGVSAIYAVVWLLIMPHLPERANLALMALAVTALSIMTIRLKQVHLARHILLGGMWLMMTLTVLTAGGTLAPIFGLYTMIVMVAALVSGWRMAFSYAILTIVASLLMVIADPQGLYNTPLATPLSAWLSQTTIMIVVTGAAYYILNQTQQALAQARQLLAERDTIENALRESEERFRIISSVTSDYTFSSRLDEDGNLQHILLTGAFEAITGYTAEEFMTIGGWRATLHPDDIAADERALAALQHNQKVINEVRTITKDGDVRWVRVYAHPVWDDEQQQLVGINGGVQDITERKEADEAIFGLNVELQDKANQLHTLIDIAHDISAVTDLSSTLKRVLNNLQKTLPLDTFFIALYDSDTQSVTYPLMYDAGKFYEEQPSVLHESGAIAQILRTGEPILVNRTVEEIATKTDKNLRVGDIDQVSASILTIPLSIGKETIGVISVQSYTLNSYDAKHAKLLGDAAYQIAIAIQNARLYDSLHIELTERKRLESELQEYANKLEVLVDERTQALRRAKEQVELILTNTSDQGCSVLVSIEIFGQLWEGNAF